MTKNYIRTSIILLAILSLNLSTNGIEARRAGLQRKFVVSKNHKPRSRKKITKPSRSTHYHNHKKSINTAPGTLAHAALKQHNRFMPRSGQKPHSRKKTIKPSRSIHYRNHKKSIHTTPGTLVYTALKQHNRFMPPVKWQHITSPTFNRNTLTGYHYRTNSRLNKQNSPKIIKMLTRKNKLGLYRARFSMHGQQKDSTFFPDSWSFQHLKNKAKEAFLNPVKVTGDRSFIGQTNAGIKIKFWLHRNQMGTLEISSLYPQM